MKYSEFATRLREIRAMLGLTQKEMSEKLGCSRASYAYYETDKNTPDINFLKALHDLPELAEIPELDGISFDYLLGYPVARKLENINIVEKYGLSEKALSMLEELYSSQRNNSITLTVNTLLENVEKIPVLDIISKYLYYNLDEEVFNRNDGFNMLSTKYKYYDKVVSEPSSDKNHSEFVDPELSIIVLDNEAIKRNFLLELEESLVELLRVEEQKDYFTDR